MLDMAVKNPECPVCGADHFKDGRGLSGHLQFKHQLSGKEHEKKLNEGMARGRKKKAPVERTASAVAGGGDEASNEAGSQMSAREKELMLRGELAEVEDELEEIRENRSIMDRMLSKRSREIEQLEGRKAEIQEKLDKLQKMEGLGQ